MKLVTRWLDARPDSAGTFNMGGLANRESAHYLRPVDSHASHHNHYDRAATQPTLPSIWDGESERVAETPSSVHDARSCVNRGDTSSRVNDGGGESTPETPPNLDGIAATQSSDSVVTE